MTAKMLQECDDVVAQMQNATCLDLRHPWFASKQ